MTTKIVIVGAGIAGLGAGRYLIEKGMIPGEDFVILEASARVGGRIHTINSFDAETNHLPSDALGIDLGAQWMHGRVNNPVYHLALHYDLVEASCGKEFHLYTADGSPVFGDRSKSKAWTKARMAYAKLGMDIDERTDNILRGEDNGDTLRKGRQRVDSMKTNRPAYSDLSVLDAWNKSFSIIGRLAKPKYTNLKTLEGQFLAWLQSSTEQYEGADSSELSIAHEYFEVVCAGGDSEIKGGYKLLVDKLLGERWRMRGEEYGSLQDAIRLDHFVELIDYEGSSSSDQSVQVKCKNGKIFACESCIISLPLGFLQKSLQSAAIPNDNLVTFQPPLPEWKSSAILKMGVGLMNKVVLQFPVCFWPQNASTIGYTSDTEKGEWRFLYNMYPATETPILVAFLTANFAWKMEKLSDEEHINGIMSVLRKIYGSQIPEPSNYCITRWGSNPLTYGSYSFMKVGTVHEDYDLLIKEVDNLYWAGEHTLREHIGCVHGAYQSGRRAAKQVLMKQLKLIGQSNSESFMNA